MSIYFIRANGLVKIGFTDDLLARFKGLQTMIPVPLEFIGHMPGDKAVEAHLHRLFASTRANGEWFTEDARLRQFIDLVLCPSLPPEPKKLRTRPLTAETQDEYRRYAKALRNHAMSVWPAMTHRARKTELARALGWTERRVKSLYDLDGFFRLTADERASLDAAIAPEWFQLEQESGNDPAP